MRLYVWIVWGIDFHYSFWFYTIYFGSNFAFIDFGSFNWYCQDIRFLKMLINFDTYWVSDLYFWFRFIFVVILNLWVSFFVGFWLMYVVLRCFWLISGFIFFLFIVGFTIFIYGFRVITNVFPSLIVKLSDSTIPTRN